MNHCADQPPSSTQRQADAAATMPADVEVGVVYTYERQFMPRLLSSLRRSADGLRQRLLLVDNASDDGAEQWRPLFPNMRVICNDRRLGYAENLNRILAASNSPFVLLLNTDMYFEPNQQCVAKTVQFMRDHPSCGVAGCRLLHGDGVHAPSARRFQTIPMILARRLGLSSWMRHTIRQYLYQDKQIDDCWCCDWLSGCFLMVRREAHLEVGPFDEGFGKYFEDVDYCLRMAKAGWHVSYNGATFCYHLEQRDSKRLFSADARRHFVAYMRWLRKWGFWPGRQIAAQHGPAPSPSQTAPARRAA